MLRMSKNIIWLLALLGISILLTLAFFLWASSGSYPKNDYAEIVNYDSQAEADQNKIFSVLTYNVGYFSGLTNNQPVTRDSQLFTANLASTIDSLKPIELDLIGLQEVDINSHRSFGINQVRQLATGLGLSQGAIAINWDKRYVPFPFLPVSAHFRRVVSGQAVLSRYPITNHERIVLDKVESQPFFYRAFYLDRLAQITQIDVQGTPLIVINVHLEAFDTETRLKQTKYLQALINEYVHNYAVLIIGDFNSLPPSREESETTIKALLDIPEIASAVPLENLNDPDNATFPSDRPIGKIDYIFYTPTSIKPLEWRIVSEVGQASDHLPVMLKFELR